MKTAEIIAEYPLAAPRNYAVDACRVVACFGVILIHMHNSTLAAETLSRFFLYFCVPYFYIAALGYFSASLGRANDVGRVLRKIGKRIGIPFLVWSVIYTGLIFAKSLLTHHDFTFSPVRTFLYGESAEHLYYLPELIVMELLIFGSYLLVATPRRSAGIGMCLVALTYLAWGHLKGYYGLTANNSVILYMLTAFLVALKVYGGGNRRFLAVGIICILFATSSDFILYPLIVRQYVVPLPIGGIGIFLLAVNMPQIQLPRWVSVLALATYGIYLSHVAFLEAFETALDLVHYKLEYNVPTKLVLTLFILGCCTVFVLVARQNRYTRLLLLGED